jgi:hypothetical protein
VSAEEQRPSPPLPAPHPWAHLGACAPHCAPLYSTIPHGQCRSLPSAPHSLPSGPFRAPGQGGPEGAGPAGKGRRSRAGSARAKPAPSPRQDRPGQLVRPASRRPGRPWRAAGAGRDRPEREASGGRGPAAGTGTARGPRARADERAASTGRREGREHGQDRREPRQGGPAGAAPLNLATASRVFPCRTYCLLARSVGHHGRAVSQKPGAHCGAAEGEGQVGS